MSDPIETNLKRQITRLSNIVKNKPMTVERKLEIHRRIQELQERWRQYRLARDSVHMEQFHAAILDIKTLNDITSKMVKGLPARDCEHGQLARSCELCELRKQRDEAHHLLGRCETFIKAIDPVNGRHILADIASARGEL